MSVKTSSISLATRADTDIHDITDQVTFNVAQSGLKDGTVTVVYGSVGAVFTGLGLWQLRWLGLQAALFVMLGLFLLYAAGANFFEGRKYK